MMGRKMENVISLQIWLCWGVEFSACPFMEPLDPFMEPLDPFMEPLDPFMEPLDPFLLGVGLFSGANCLL